MTNEEAIEVLAQDLPCETDEDLSEAMTMAIKALEQQPCEDAISRKDMLAVFRQSNSLSQAWNGFEKLSPVTPKEKTGHWIERKLAMMIHDWKCDQCRMVTNERTNFCPNCGAKMEVENDG